jgi:hypothetical protein
MQAPEDHWIHEEGDFWKYHGEPGPSNPYLGHALERSWPTIFGCLDPHIADNCGDDDTMPDVPDVTCQCLDEPVSERGKEQRRKW